MNSQIKHKILPGKESLSEEMVAAIDVFDKTKAILDRTYTALGRSRQNGVINTAGSSYLLKIDPNEQSTTNKIQIKPGLA